MRTAAQIRISIEKNNNLLIHFDDLKKSKIKQIVKQNEILTEMLIYLETNPKEEFLLSEKKRLKRIITAKQSQFYYWRTSVLTDTISQSKATRLFCKETGITGLRKQLKNLNFLLNENQEYPAVK